MGGDDGCQSVCLFLLHTLDVDGNARRSNVSNMIKF